MIWRVDVNVAAPLLLGLLVLVAAVIRQWWAIVLPLVAVPIFYAGLRGGWWGAGLGDGWQYGAVAMTVVSVLGCALAVVVARYVAGIGRQAAPPAQGND